MADNLQGAMLRNFLDALGITGASNKLKRVILTTGAKQLGVHLGPPKQPMEESDPRVDGPGRPPSSYYNQQNILAERSKNASRDYVVTYPNDVIGLAKGNFMNLATFLGIHAAVPKEIDGQLLFPSSETFHTCFDCFIYTLNSTYPNAAMKHSMWSMAMLNRGRICGPGRREGLQDSSESVRRSFGNDAGSVMDLTPEPPMAEEAAERGLERRVKPGKVEQRIDLVTWSQRPDIKRAWGGLAVRGGLKKDGLAKATWGFLGFVLGRNYNPIISMSKARKLGRTGYIDTWDSLSECFDELEKKKILPKTGSR